MHEMYTPLNPLLYIVKMGFTGANIFLIFAPKHRLWVLRCTAEKKITVYCMSKFS